VQFIDSTGLGVLVGAQRRLRNGGGTMAVLGNERIRRMFDQTGLTTLLGFESSPS
jgi:anti-sigma B factor antagonist